MLHHNMAQGRAGKQVQAKRENGVGQDGGGQSPIGDHHSKLNKPYPERQKSHFLPYVELR